jgi:hypothetical protein
MAVPQGNSTSTQGQAVSRWRVNRLLTHGGSSANLELHLSTGVKYENVRMFITGRQRSARLCRLGLRNSSSHQGFGLYLCSEDQPRRM